MKIVTIIGARPQFIKAAAVSRAIAEHNKLVNRESSVINELIVHTGQHYDRNMSDVFFEEMHIPKPNYFLDIHSLSHGAMTGQMLEKIEEVLMDEKPDVVLVYGDTNTTLAGALAASKLNIPVTHVEAGLRSFNRRMPEEINRVLTDHVSTILFCPTKQAVENLKNEGIVNKSSSVHKFVSSSAQELTDLQAHELPRSVALVGDVMLDAAQFYRRYAKRTKFDLPEKYILATIHRAENTDDPERLISIFKAFEKISQEIPIILPLHPRTAKIIHSLGFCLKPQTSNLKLSDPVSYLEMVYLLERCKLVMTDSGGLQKEAFFFKKPCVTLRDETEWVELVDHGFNVIVGVDNKRIFEAFELMTVKDIDYNINLYGDGEAGEKIVNILKKHLSLLHQ